MAGLQPVRGTHDLFPADMRRHRMVIDTARAVAERYGYGEIATPIFEFSEVFQRTLGDTSDIVTKEMYSFTDRGGENITLRPEYTAGIARAFISGGLQHQLPLKLFCHGPMFRYERPQKGRLRQFHQIDVELLGVAGPQADIEVIALGWDILTELKISDKCVLELNTLGDMASRAAYRMVLVDYFQAHKSGLSQDSLDRLDRNPLRILDSKDEGDRRIVAGAPSFQSYLNQESAEFFLTVKAGLDTLHIPNKMNARLVRGLDYYCHTAFEFTTADLGAQGTVLGGGRYDGLIETMGGPPTPGIGWAAGIERLAMLIAEPPTPPRPLAIVPMGQAGEAKALVLARDLRRAGFAVELSYGGNMKKRMQRANKVNARAAVILGEDELQRGAAAVRDLDSGEQTEIPLDRLEAHLARFR